MNLKQMFYEAYKEAYNANDNNEDSKNSTEFQMALA
jgi:hypothetical protein